VSRAAAPVEGSSGQTRSDEERDDNSRYTRWVHESREAAHKRKLARRKKRKSKTGRSET